MKIDLVVLTVFLFLVGMVVLAVFLPDLTAWMTGIANRLTAP